MSTLENTSFDISISMPADQVMSNISINTQNIPFPENIVVPTDQRFIDREMANIEQLNAVNVDPKYQEWVRVFDTYQDAPDSSQKLYLLHYLTVSDESLQNEVMKHIGHVRGSILNEKNKVVCQSFGYTREATEFQGFNKFYPVYEGTVIRLFFYNHWFISTHRKIDASFSRWSGPTFGDMFQELFQMSEDELDKTNVYIYILQHVENRHLLPIKKSRLIHVANFKNELTITMQPILLTTSIKEYVERAFLENSNSVGLLTFVDNAPVKIVSQRYLDLKNVRGNDPQVTTRYTHLFAQPEKQKVLKQFYPEYAQQFKNIDRAFEDLSKFIHSGYINMFVKKLNVKFSKENHVVMMRCHSWYKEDAKNRTVRLNVVKDMLRTTPVNYFTAMMNEIGLKQ
jgi:hypothetical protein